MSAYLHRRICGCCLLIAATECDYLVPNMHGRIPGDRNGILHACMGRAALVMNSNCAYAILARVRWDGEVVMNSSRLNADVLSSIRIAFTNPGARGLAVIT